MINNILFKEIKINIIKYQEHKYLKYYIYSLLNN